MISGIVPPLANEYSVLARHISEGAAPCPYCLAPCPNLQKKFFFFFLQNVIAVFVFSDRDVKMLVKCLQICAHVFIDCPQNYAQTSFRSCAGLRPNLVIRALNCARLCVVRALNCARILVVRALDCAQFLLHPALFPT